MRRSIHNELDFQLLRLHVKHIRQRYDVFKAIKRLQPCTVADLQRALEGRMARSTVIRTVALFVARGIALRPEGKHVSLASNLHQHFHVLTCRQCGREIPYRDIRLEKAIDRLVKEKNFSPSGHSLAIVGLCGKHVLTHS